MSTSTNENVGIALGLVVAAGASTGIGAAVVFIPTLVKLANRRVLAGSLGFAAGVMCYVSYIEIFSKSILSFENAGHDENRAYIYSTLCFFCGVVTMILLNMFVARLLGGHGHSHRRDETHGRPRAKPSTRESVDAKVVEPSALPCCSRDPIGQLETFQRMGSVLQHEMKGCGFDASIPADDAEESNENAAEDNGEGGNDDPVVKEVGVDNFPLQRIDEADYHFDEGLDASVPNRSGCSKRAHDDLDEGLDASVPYRSDCSKHTHDHLDEGLDASFPNRSDCSKHTHDHLDEGLDASVPNRSDCSKHTHGSDAGKKHRVDQTDDDHEHKKLVKMGLNTALAIGLHNFPEGLATFVAALGNAKVGAVLAIAIAIHNIPEGLCVALPIYYATGNRLKAFLWALLSGASEIVAALLGWAILANSFSDNAYAILFGLVAGMMVIISIRELLPTAHFYDPEDTLVTYSFIGGMALMALSLVLFKI